MINHTLPHIYTVATYDLGRLSPIKASSTHCTCIKTSPSVATGDARGEISLHTPDPPTTTTEIYGKRLPVSFGLYYSRQDNLLTLDQKLNPIMESRAILIIIASNGRFQSPHEAARPEYQLPFFFFAGRSTNYLRHFSLIRPPSGYR